MSYGFAETIITVLELVFDENISYTVHRRERTFHTVRYPDVKKPCKRVL